MYMNITLLRKTLLQTRTLLLIGFIVALLSFSFVAHAQNPSTGSGGGNGVTSTGSGGGNGVTSTGSGGGDGVDVGKLQNPLGGTVDDLPGFIESLINIVLLVGIPLVALAIIYSGFLFVAAQGNPEKLKDAKKAFLFTLVGAAIVLGAFVIANAIGGTIEELRAS
jgi:hypothetical protein